MHGLLSGLMGMIMGFSSFFHGANGTPPAQSQANSQPQASVSGQQNNMWGKHKGRMMMKFPTGDKAFFGLVTNVNGNTITIQTMTHPFMHMHPNDPSITPMAQNMTIDLTSSTQYTGGSQSDITNNTRIIGYGTVNSDQSITALQVRINPPMPSGFPHWRMGANNQPPSPTQ